MRQTPFDEWRFLKIKEAEAAFGADLSMLVEEINALREENTVLQGELARFRETTPEDPVFQ